MVTGNAQNLKAGRIKKVKTETAGYFPSFGPGNKEIVFTGLQNQGLTLLNIKTGKESRITDETVNSSSIHITADNKIIYTLRGGTKENQVIKAYNTLSGINEEVSSPSVNRPEVTGKGKKMIYTGPMDNAKELTPFGDVFYLWPSMSPDNTKILFTAATKGSYVCDLEGNIIAELGTLNAPSWINNEWVLGMQDTDNGETIQASKVLAIHVASGKTVDITGKSDVIAVYPKASQDGRKIVFQNPAGELFITRIVFKK